jgi:hypothetical protein
MSVTLFDVPTMTMVHTPTELCCISYSSNVNCDSYMHSLALMAFHVLTTKQTLPQLPLLNAGRCMHLEGHVQHLLSHPEWKRQHSHCNTAVAAGNMQKPPKRAFIKVTKDLEALRSPQRTAA